MYLIEKKSPKLYSGLFILPQIISSVPPK